MVAQTRAPKGQKQKRVVGRPFTGLDDPRRHKTGRPKGSRHKLGEEFIAGLQIAWEKVGEAALMRVIQDKPEVFINALVRLVPAQLDVGTDDERVGFRSVLAALGHASRSKDE